MRKLPTTKIASEFIPFQGGLDVVTPVLHAQRGTCSEAQNFVQDINGGYRTYTGYERYDGQTSPSDALYAVLDATGIVGGSVGDTLDGAVSAASGEIITITATSFILTKLSGTFQAENVLVGAAVVGVSTGEQVVDGASTTLLHAQYNNLAADVYRADIVAVPGSGNILGIVSYGDVQYAFRNNAGSTAAVMYKSTSSGWSLVALGRELSFTSGGTYVVAEGDEIEGETSGAKATLTRVVLETGTFAGGNASGRFIFASQTGTFQSENIKVGANANVATLSSDSSAITFAVSSGRFEFITHNFGGSNNTNRLYGCDGKNRGFEFDGAVFVPINTTMTADTPEHIQAHRNHLFFSFGGSVQHSSPGSPYIWSPILGASELAMGDTVTGFMSQAGDITTAALAIFSRNSLAMLYGTCVTDWSLVTYKKDAGAIAHTVQMVGVTLMLDDRGITSLRSSEKYGNFEDATLSKRIQPWLRTKRPNVTASCVLRDANQYCLFFSDKSAIYITIDNGKLQGMMPLAFDHPVLCIDSYETSGGLEEVFFGDDTGYIYQMEKGTSFDGGDIEAFITLHYDSSQSPTILKKYRRLLLELDGMGYYSFKFSYDLDYLSTDVEQPDQITKELTLSSAFWDTAFWDAFFWDGTSLIPGRMSMLGSGTNLALKFWSKGDYYLSCRFNGAIVEYTPMRSKR